MGTQMNALTRTIASTWGATMIKARQIYLAMIRPAMSYGASLWHKPSDADKSPKGLVATLKVH